MIEVSQLIKEFADRESDLGKLATSQNEILETNNAIDYDSSLAADSFGDFICPEETDKPWYNDESDFIDAKTLDDVFDIEQTDGTQITTIEQNSDVEEIGKAGGRYQDLKIEGWGWNTEPPTEVHHMPSDYSSELDRNDGPAIVMDYEDHRETASCGNSLDAREYREKQAELIKEGKFREALQMDIDDIHEKFGDKYDEAIEKMLKYVDELEQNNKI